MKRNLLLAATVVFLAVGATGFYMYNKPRPGLKNAKPVASMSANALYEDYSSDEDAANTNYLGKVIEVEGRIAEITVKDEANVSLVLDCESAPMGGVTAAIDTRHSSASHLKPGDIVTVKGRCTGMLMDVVLVDCIIR